MRARRIGLSVEDAGWSFIGCCRTRRRGRSVDDAADLADSLLWMGRERFSCRARRLWSAGGAPEDDSADVCLRDANCLPDVDAGRDEDVDVGRDEDVDLARADAGCKLADVVVDDTPRRASAAICCSFFSCFSKARIRSWSDTL